MKKFVQVMMCMVFASMISEQVCAADLLTFSRDDVHKLMKVCKQLQQEGHDLDKILALENAAIGDAVLGGIILGSSLGLLALCTTCFCFICCKTCEDDCRSNSGEEARLVLHRR